MNIAAIAPAQHTTAPVAAPPAPPTPAATPKTDSVTLSPASRAASAPDGDHDAS